MPWMIPAAIIGGSLLSSQSASSAADTAAQASGQASAASVGEQRREFDINQTNQQPWLTAGTGAVNQLAEGLKPGGQFASVMPFNFQYDKNDPAFTFSFDQGMRGINASMAAKGMGGSGAGIKGAAGFAENLANSYYGDAFNRYVTGFNAQTGERNQLYNRYAGVAGTGQQAANQIGAQGANMASNIGNTLMSNAANTGNAAMAASGRISSYIGDTANVLGRMYGNYGRNPTSTAPSTDPYSPDWISNYPGYTG